MLKKQCKFRSEKTKFYFYYNLNKVLEKFKIQP